MREPKHGLLDDASGDARAVGAQANVFSTTHWTIVLEACHGSSGAAKALDALCSIYWYPIYAFIRRRGHDLHGAEDLTQAFFKHLLETEALKTVGREKGKFRSFLLTAVTNFLNNEWDKLRTEKRGGRYQIVSLDDLKLEERYRCEPVDDLTPERLFEKRWAWILVEQALGRLKSEYEQSGKGVIFQELQLCLTREGESGFIAGAAARLGMNEGAVKVAMHRLRRRFGQALREEVKFTVASEDQIAEEIRHLLAAISSD